MSTANSTLLHIGMVGTLFNKRYRVAGRVVMGMVEDGVTYYWNEFNLVDMEGNSETLVYEETESGAEWRLFTLFEPKNPMTAATAVSVRLGNQVDVDSKKYQVSLTGTSKVYHIEGQAPEGVEVGDVAHYFNAEAGRHKIVASWTDDEVEYYQGNDTTAAMVREAFGLRILPLVVPSRFQAEKAATQRTRTLKWIAVGIIFAVGLWAFWSCNSDSNVTPRPTQLQKAPASPILVGSSGHVSDKDYHVQSHQVVEIAQVGQRYEQHEYQLSDSDGGTALLIFQKTKNVNNWVLFTPATIHALTPIEAGAKKIGDFVAIGNEAERVSQIFKATTRKTEPQYESATNPIYYGLTAGKPARPLMARWTENGISCYKGELVTDKSVNAAFSVKTHLN